MKYIKIFESYQYRGRYWKVKTKQPYLNIALMKIGAPERRFDFFNNENFFKENNIRVNHIFIEQFYDHPNRPIWEWDITSNVVLKSLKYMGEVKITPEDIEEYKMKKDAEKYNL